jgi:hypothetical protein
MCFAMMVIHLAAKINPTHVVCIPFYHEVSHDYSYDSHSSFNNPKGNTFLLVVCSSGGHETVCFIASR